MGLSMAAIRRRLAAEGALANLRGFGCPLEDGWMKLERPYLLRKFGAPIANEVGLSLAYATHAGLVEVRRRVEYRIIADQEGLR